MNNPINRIAKRVLRQVGYEVRRVGAAVPDGNRIEPGSDKYTMLVKELHGAIRELIFPSMPSCERREELLARLVGTPVSEAIYLIAHLHESMNVEGDVCEFGIAQGATSALLANEIRSTAKRMWLFDSFQGLPAPTKKDVLINDIFRLGSIEKYAGTMACPIDMVKARMREIGFPDARTRIVAGFIEKTVKAETLPGAVCFAYVDFDFYEPILTALRFLRERLSVGGCVVVDDYGFFSSGAKTAVDEFVAETGDEFDMTLPLAFAAASHAFLHPPPREAPGQALTAQQYSGASGDGEQPHPSRIRTRSDCCGIPCTPPAGTAEAPAAPARRAPPIPSA